MKCILVAMDVVRPESVCLTAAVRLASSLEARMFLVNVVTPQPEFLGLAAGPQSVRDARAAEIRRARADMRQVTARLRQGGAAVGGMVVEGDIVKSLLQACTRVEADLLVLAMHRRRRIGHAVLGSVCDSVLRRTVVPVLLVPEESE